MSTGERVGIVAYPLCWPTGQKRTPYFNKENGNFKTSRHEVIKELLYEISMMQGVNPIISTNVECKRDGTPYANSREPDDSGAAVYFKRNGRDMCFPCDKYIRVTANLRAISKTIGALRGIERWGGVELMDKAFSGFAQLPAPMDIHPPWFEILGVPFDADMDSIRAAKIRLSHELHPDKTGGDIEKANRLASVNAAAEEGMQLRRGQQ